MQRLEEANVIEIIEQRCQIIIGKLSVTPIKRHQNANLEYIVDCDHYKAKCSVLHKTSVDAAKQFCMLKNVIYGGKKNDI